MKFDHDLAELLLGYLSLIDSEGVDGLYTKDEKHEEYLMDKLDKIQDYIGEKYPDLKEEYSPLWYYKEHPKAYYE